MNLCFSCRALPRKSPYPNNPFSPGSEAMAAQVPRYQYSPVDSVSGEIRLLTIRPGSLDAPLDLRLDTRRRITTQSAAPGSYPPPPSYEALSYTWGDQESLVDVPIGSAKQFLSVTRNLAVALPFLRLPDRDRVIWIDAVCINQSDLQERGLQVQLMADIFQKAVRVVCWVGLESTTSELALQMIRDISRRVDVDMARQRMRPIGEENKDWADMSNPLPYDVQAAHVLSEFFSRAWFERLWVFQEIRLAANRALLQCGSATLEWPRVMKAVWCFHNKPWSSPISAAFQQRLEMVRQLFNSNSTNLALLIRRTVYFKCTDPRDRLYALISLRRQDERQLRIAVDYTKSPGKVYQSYVHEYVSVLKSLRLLSFCEIQSQSFHPDTPTWVPDWSRPQHANAPRAQQYAAGYMPASITGITEDELRVTGVHVTTIQKATVMDIKNDSGDAATVELIRRCAPPGVLEQRSYPGDGSISMLEAYCCTMCHDTFSNRISPERVLFPSFSESLRTVGAFLKESSPVKVQPGSSASHYCRLVRDMCAGRSFVLTTDGGMGLAPATAQPGDQIAVILGCRSLMLLRPRLTKQQHQVVGLAYVHGMNNAEPLFGPLPSHYRPVLLCDNGHFTEQLFLDTRSNKLDNHDPRLADFDEAEMTPALYFGGKAPSIAALKARGRDLRILVLV